MFTFRYLGGSLPHVALMMVLSIVIFFSPTKTYIFHTFGFIWGAASIFTFITTFFVLPILLSIIGPRSNEVPDEEVGLKLFDTKHPGKVMGGPEVEIKGAVDAEPDFLKPEPWIEHDYQPAEEYKEQPEALSNSSSDNEDNSASHRELY